MKIMRPLLLFLSVLTFTILLALTANASTTTLYPSPDFDGSHFLLTLAPLTLSDLPNTTALILPTGNLTCTNMQAVLQHAVWADRNFNNGTIGTNTKLALLTTLLSTSLKVPLSRVSIIDESELCSADVTLTVIVAGEKSPMYYGAASSAAITAFGVLFNKPGSMTNITSAMQSSLTTTSFQIVSLSRPGSYINSNIPISTPPSTASVIGPIIALFLIPIFVVSVGLFAYVRYVKYHTRKLRKTKSLDKQVKKIVEKEKIQQQQRQNSMIGQAGHVSESHGTSETPVTASTQANNVSMTPSTISARVTQMRETLVHALGARSLKFFLPFFLFVFFIGIIPYITGHNGTDWKSRGGAAGGCSKFGYTSTQTAKCNDDLAWVFLQPISDVMIVWAVCFLGLLTFIAGIFTFIADSETIIAPLLSTYAFGWFLHGMYATWIVNFSIRVGQVNINSILLTGQIIQSVVALVVLLVYQFIPLAILRKRVQWVIFTVLTAVVLIVHLTVKTSINSQSADEIRVLQRACVALDTIALVGSVLVLSYTNIKQSVVMRGFVLNLLVIWCGSIITLGMTNSSSTNTTDILLTSPLLGESLSRSLYLLLGQLLLLSYLIRHGIIAYDDLEQVQIVLGVIGTVNQNTAQQAKVKIMSILPENFRTGGMKEVGEEEEKKEEGEEDEKEKDGEETVQGDIEAGGDEQQQPQDSPRSGNTNSKNKKKEKKTTITSFLTHLYTHSLRPLLLDPSLYIIIILSGVFTLIPIVSDRLIDFCHIKGYDSTNAENFSLCTYDIASTIRGAFDHEILELSSSFLCLSIFLLSLAHFHTRRDWFTVLYGIAFLGTGFVDIFHTMVGMRILHGSDTTNFIPFSWSVSRIYNSIILTVGTGFFIFSSQVRTPILTSTLPRPFAVIFCIGIVLLIPLVIVCVMISHVSVLPTTQFTGTAVARPYDLVPLILYCLFCIEIFILCVIETKKRNKKMSQASEEQHRQESSGTQPQNHNQTQLHQQHTQPHPNRVSLIHRTHHGNTNVNASMLSPSPPPAAEEENVTKLASTIGNNESKIHHHHTVASPKGATASHHPRPASTGQGANNASSGSPIHQLGQTNLYFLYGLAISSLPQIITQCYMAFGSTALFDDNFNIAHFMKIFAYLFPFVAMMIDIGSALLLKNQVIRVLNKAISGIGSLKHCKQNASLSTQQYLNTKNGKKQQHQKSKSTGGGGGGGGGGGVALTVTATATATAPEGGKFHPRGSPALSVNTQGMQSPEQSVPLTPKQQQQQQLPQQQQPQQQKADPIQHHPLTPRESQHHQRHASHSITIDTSDVPTSYLGTQIKVYDPLKNTRRTVNGALGHSRAVSGNWNYSVSPQQIVIKIDRDLLSPFGENNHNSKEVSLTTLTPQPDTPNYVNATAEPITPVPEPSAVVAAAAVAKEESV